MLSKQISWKLAKHFKHFWPMQIVGLKQTNNRFVIETCMQLMHDLLYLVLLLTGFRAFLLRYSLLLKNCIFFLQNL